MAKSTLARGLADLLASGQFVTLPLGATEERLVGTLDLDAALSEGRAQFSPGVLAKADGGVLYVDEVNLLPDHLVDLLLDVAASGTNLIERDGTNCENLPETHEVIKKIRAALDERCDFGAIVGEHPALLKVLDTVA